MDAAASDTPLLNAQGLVKDFGSKKGIFGVDLLIAPGEVVGFVGPNGAGKSTTINILTGLIKPNKGSFSIFGKPSTYQTVYKIAGNIGVMYSEPTMPEGLTAKQVFMQTEEVLKKDCSKNWRSMAKDLELDINKPIRKLSLGNKKKVGVVHAFMHEPDLIIMDEPTSGLDPVIRERFLGFIRAAAARGAGVLLSSHDLGEVQEISDRIVMIKAGHIIMTDTTDNILNRAERLFRLIKPPETLVSKIKKSGLADRLHATHQELTFHTTKFEEASKLITVSGFYNFFVERPNLEDTFKEYYE